MSGIYDEIMNKRNNRIISIKAAFTLNNLSKNRVSYCFTLVFS
jgi:hypothetical protein